MQTMRDIRLPQRVSFARSPVSILWEITRACALACKYCRGEANPNCHPRELTTDEGKRLLAEMRAFGDPATHLVITGGDPMLRDDVFTLVELASTLGLGVSVGPGVSDRLTQHSIWRLKAAGAETITLNLDGASPESHDSFRGAPGLFEQTVEAARWVRRSGLELEINTVVADGTLRELPKIYDMVRGLDSARWRLVFPVAAGRARSQQPVNAWQGEILMRWLDTQAQDGAVVIDTVEAPQYRRIALERMRSAGMSLSAIRQTAVGRRFGIRDGNGIIFISHVGDVYPSEFLPVVAGNVRGRSLIEIYRRSTLFRALRDLQLLTGKCKRCPFRGICGGSRARAYAATGDYMAGDPLCAFEARA